LKARKHLTLLFDGWEDRLQHSLYGTVAAEHGEPPSILSLDELTGSQGTAEKYHETKKAAIKKMDLDDGQNFVALTTDNLTVMQAYRRLTRNAYFWIIVSSVCMPLPLIIISDLTMFSAWAQHYYWQNHCISCYEMSHLPDCPYCELL
jgi:hypothetical protein